MPEVKIKHVVSCSSEDKNNPAENLLKPEGTHKWKCLTAGEKQVSVVLQFEKASQIHSLDIGNEGSAFVEVLVGRSSAPSDVDYQVLLVASAFMTPLESRNGTNRTGVRMFSADKLSKTVVKEKWDRAKVVCTQPFNKTSTFGLSFIKFHSTPETSNSAGAEKKLGFFKLKDGENGDLHTGTLFTNRNKTPAKVEPMAPVTGAAAVRAASRLAEESKPTTSSTPSSEKKQTTPVVAVEKKRKDSPTVSQPESKEKVKPRPENREKRKYSASSDEETEKTKPAMHRKSTSITSTASSKRDKDQTAPPLKKTKSLPAKESPAKVFHRLMDKVVFVMSGFQNPYRTELRDKAVEMGAIYKPDWGKTCTHLICAFPNTPKYQQVEGKGKIVTKNWILDCHKQRKLLPWRKYRLGDAESPSESSDDDDESWNPVAKKSPPKKMPTKTEVKKTDTPKKKVTYKDDEDEDEYGGDTDSGEDTEEEVQRVKAKLAKESPTKGGNGDDPYGASTDEDENDKTVAMETDDGADSGIPELPDFFTDKIFFFYGKMEASERRLLTRYITAYNGEIEEYMSDKVKYVISSVKWDGNFDDALSDNPNLVFVKPRWVFTCHEKEKCVPHQPYIVVPE